MIFNHQDILKTAVLLEWISTMFSLSLSPDTASITEWEFTSLVFLELFIWFVSLASGISLIFFQRWAKKTYLLSSALLYLLPSSLDEYAYSFAEIHFLNWSIFASGFIFSLLLFTDCYEKGMKQKGKYAYRVYHHPTLGYKAIKEGISISAFFFTTLWALVNKLWAHAIITAVILSLIYGVTTLIGDAVATLPLQASLITMAVFGLLGNSWRTSALIDRGFTQVKFINTSSGDKAIAIVEELKNASVTK